MKKLFFTIVIAGCFCACSQSTDTTAFVKVKDGHFQINGKPYYYIGTNFWYGAILGSEGQGGNRERLEQELDLMHDIGINNLRILVGADGLDGQAVKVRPALQTAPGVYNDTIFDGLDYLLAEMEKRGMRAVLYVNNSWEWSGGYGQYLEWAGYGSVPPEGVRNWQKFLKHVSKYATCGSCKTLFFNHLRNVITRTNRYTGKKYIDDPTIMAWQVGNEPRPFSNESKPAFVQWLKEATALIRSLDPNHLISLGSEGAMGCENDMQLVETINADANVDYMTIHIWPGNWNWIDSDTYVVDYVDTVITNTNMYINKHATIAEKLHKPLVIEEFAYPRDDQQYETDDPTTARDKYYKNIFAQVLEASKDTGIVAGCNFWAWGGFGRPANRFWQVGDDYLGDPAGTEQGLNSVFNEGSTVKVIKNFTFAIEDD